MQKKSFTLLEVLLAISLVALAGPILFSVPFRLAKQEMLALHAAEFARLADLEWNSIKIQLLNQEIPWKTLAKAESNPLLLEERTGTIVFSKQHRLPFVVKKMVTESRKKILSKDREGRLVNIKISFIPKTQGAEQSFEYKIAILNSSS